MNELRVGGNFSQLVCFLLNTGHFKLNISGIAEPMLVLFEVFKSMEVKIKMAHITFLKKLILSKQLDKNQKSVDTKKMTNCLVTF
jgi:hypothetical protein